MDRRKGNQFWKQRSKHGRDRLFATPQLMLEAAQEYFQWCEDNPWIKHDVVRGGESAGQPLMVPIQRPYTSEGLCGYLGCNLGYFNDFYNAIKEKSDKESKDFSAVITYIKETIYRQKYEGAAVGIFNSNIIARDLGLKDSSQQEITGSIKTIEIVPVAKKDIE